MNCPYCDFRFKVLAMNTRALALPDVAPLVCEKCGEVSLLIDGRPPRKVTVGELSALKESPAWREMIAPVKKLIAARKKTEN